MRLLLLCSLFCSVLFFTSLVEVKTTCLSNTNEYYKDDQIIESVYHMPVLKGDQDAFYLNTGDNNELDSILKQFNYHHQFLKRALEEESSSSPNKKGAGLSIEIPKQKVIPKFTEHKLDDRHLDSPYSQLYDMRGSSLSKAYVAPPPGTIVKQPSFGRPHSEPSSPTYERQDSSSSTGSSAPPSSPPPSKEPVRRRDKVRKFFFGTKH